MPNTLILVIVFACAGLVEGVTGFGAALVALGLLAGVMPISESVAIVAVLSLCTSAYNLWTVRRHLLWREIGPILLTGLPSIALGVYLLNHLPAESLRAGLVVIILAGCGTVLWSPGKAYVKRPVPWAYVTGLLSGTFGGALSTAGPPVVLYSLLRGWEKAEAKAVLCSCFTIMGTLRLGLYLATGVADIPTVGLGLLLVIPAMATSYLGVLIFRRLSSRAFRYAAVALLMVLAAKLVLT